MGKNVLIPIPLVKRIIELLEYWNITDYDRAIRDGYWEILQELNMKLQKLEVRDAYSKIIAARSDDEIHNARMAYLWQKARLNDIAADGCIF